MKNISHIILLCGLLAACSSEPKQNEETSNSSIKETEVIEESTQNLDKSIKESDLKMMKTQSEIDSLLNDI